MLVLQDARKGVLFDDFPPVLQLQLKRFEYDFQRDMMIKVQSPPLPKRCFDYSECSANQPFSKWIALPIPSFLHNTRPLMYSSNFAVLVFCVFPVGFWLLP